MIIETIPSEVFGVTINNVEIIHKKVEEVELQSSYGMVGGIIGESTFYYLSKNGIKLGHIFAIYFSQDNENYKEENLKGFFTEWFSSINNNV